MDDLSSLMRGARVDVRGSEGDFNQLAAQLANTAIDDDVKAKARNTEGGKGSARAPPERSLDDQILILAGADPDNYPHPYGGASDEVRYEEFLEGSSTSLLYKKLPDGPAELDLLCKSVADEIVKRYLRGDARLPPLSPKAHPNHPYWVPGNHPSDAIITWTLAKLRQGHKPRFYCPPNRKMPLYADYGRWLEASGHELADESLPGGSDLDELSEWMMDSITLNRLDGAIRCLPFSPKRHPIHPFWVRKHPLNYVIKEVWNMLLERETRTQMYFEPFLIIPDYMARHFNQNINQCWLEIEKDRRG